MHRSFKNEFKNRISTGKRQTVRIPCFLGNIPETGFELKEPDKVEALAQLYNDWLPQDLSAGIQRKFLFTKKKKNID